MYDEGKSMFDVKLIQELFEPSAIELGTVVYDDGLREAIMAYDGLSDERLHLGLNNVGHGLSFDPFSEVIYYNKEELSL